MIGCDNPKFESEDEFTINDEVTMEDGNGGNCDFLEPGQECNFVCKPDTKKSQRLGGEDVSANGVTEIHK